MSDPRRGPQRRRSAQNRAQQEADLGAGGGKQIMVMKGDNRGSSRSERELRSQRGAHHRLCFQEDETESLRDEAATPSHKGPKGHSQDGSSVSWCCWFCLVGITPDAPEPAAKVALCTTPTFPGEPEAGAGLGAS